MGFLFSKLANGPTEKKLLMLGLDNAGKTTLLYKLKLGDVVKTTPTIGFNLEQVSYKKLKFSVWDLGGQDRIRPLWRHYYQGMKGIIFVLDSNDLERCNEALDEVKLLTTEDQLKDCPILIYLNKIDLNLPNQIQENYVHAQLNNYTNTTFFIQKCSGHTGEGIYEGLDWMSKKIN